MLPHIIITLCFRLFIISLFFFHFLRVADKDCVIATLAIGFADGLERDLSNATASDRGPAYGKGGSVCINGRRCRIVGKVCMDMVMVECGPPTAASSSKNSNSGGRSRRRTASSRSRGRSSSSAEEETEAAAAATAAEDEAEEGVEVKPGDYAVCFGEGGPSLKDTASLLGTALSDVTVSITRRVWRNYINAPDPLH